MKKQKIYILLYLLDYMKFKRTLRNFLLGAGLLGSFLYPIKEAYTSSKTTNSPKQIQGSINTFIHPSRTGVPNDSLAPGVQVLYWRNPTGTIDSVWDVTNTWGKSSVFTSSFTPEPNLNDTIYIEAQDTLGQNCTAKTMAIQCG